MEMPYGMHLIETKCEITQTMHFSIPSPFKNGKIINMCAELRPRGPVVAMEVWGEVPATQLPETEVRIKLAETTIPLPPVNVSDPQFMHALTQGVIRSKAFCEATAELLDIHAGAVAAEEGPYGETD